MKTKTPSEDMGRKEYEKELARLHGELVKLQLWAVHKGLKVCGSSRAGTVPARAA